MAGRYFLAEGVFQAESWWANSPQGTFNSMDPLSMPLDPTTTVLKDE
jgi:hypothetical protein